MNTRRGFLGATLVASLPLAGCTSVIEGDDELDIHSIRIVNSDSTDHEVRVVVLHRDSVVFADQRTADAKDGNVTGGYVLSSDWRNESGEYTVAAQVDENSWRQRTLEADEGDDCVQAIVRIEEDGNGVILTASRGRVELVDGSMADSFLAVLTLF